MQNSTLFFWQRNFRCWLVVIVLSCICVPVWATDTDGLNALPTIQDSAQKDVSQITKGASNNSVVATEQSATPQNAQAGQQTKLPVTQTPFKVAPLDTSQAILKTLGGLVVIVILIFVCAKCAKLLAGPVGQQRLIIKSIASMPVGAKEKILLIEVDGKQLLIGVTTQQISMLKELPNVVQAEQIKNLPSSLSARTASEFSKKLQDFLSAGNRAA